MIVERQQRSTSFKFRVALEAMKILEAAAGTVQYTRTDVTSREAGKSCLTPQLTPRVTHLC